MGFVFFSNTYMYIYIYVYVYIRQPRLEVRTIDSTNDFPFLQPTGFLTTYLETQHLGVCKSPHQRNQKKNCWVLLKQLLHLITDSYGSNLRFQSQWNTHSQVSDHLRILKIPPTFLGRIIKNHLPPAPTRKTAQMHKKTASVPQALQATVVKEAFNELLGVGLLGGKFQQFQAVVFCRKMWWISTETASSAPLCYENGKCSPNETATLFLIQGQHLY